jgi:ElaB/YqjD/DUF883 family membrane-anchored ribosome-binding protein
MVHENRNAAESGDLAADKAAAAAAELRRGAARKAEQMRTSAAAGLDDAADALRAGGARVAGAADRASDALASGARYVRARDARGMMDDALGLVKENPAAALLGAATIGFLVGRALYRR